MSILLARTRLRGIYAISAGAIIIVVIPFFQGSILAGTGYLTAVTQISNQHDFGPYLAWVAQNQETDIIFHAVQFVAFLLIFTLPPVLADVLWPAPSRGSWLARITGQGGFGCYALAVLLGLPVSANYGGLYANASTSLDRAGVAANFGSLFALQNILSHIIGGILVAIGLMIIGAQMMRSSQKALPGWLGYFAVLVAAFLVITALQFAAAPASAETSLSSLSFFALALWLIAVGIYLARLSALPGVVGAAYSEDAASSATPDTDVGTIDSPPQPGDQSKLEETSR
ncbi:MAG: hypothetical protein ACLQUY_01940 [Ktedonobacterales bacterium]